MPDFGSLLNNLKLLSKNMCHFFHKLLNVNSLDRVVSGSNEGRRLRHRHRHAGVVELLLE